MKKSLAQQIAELEDVRPTEFDVEEDFPDRGANAASDDDEGSDDARAAREHYVDVGPSSLRKLNQQLDNSDPKYIGVKTTRSQLLEDHDDDSNSDDSEDQEPDAEDSPAHSSVSASASASSSNEPENTPPQSPNPPAHPLREPSLTSTLLASRHADRTKGKAIARQLKLWDSLVDARIRIQKGVLGANVLPTPALAKQYQNASPQTNEAVQNLLREGLALSEELFELQQTLSELQGIELPARKRRKLDASASSLNESESINFEEQLAASTQDFVTFESSLHPSHLLTLQKWSSKVQSVAPSALSLSTHKRTSFLRSSSSTTKGAVELIAETVDDRGPGREKAVGRTRVRRGVGRGRIGIGLVVNDALGGGENEGGGEGIGEDEGEGETFDDTDFYQEILRDVISSKSGQIGSELPSLRPPKSKKVVDTKASKGRKLRYETHEKIRNFMVPVPARGAWHEEQIDELFSSLMGRGRGGEIKVVGAEGDADEGMEPVSLGGLRVF